MCQAVTNDKRSAGSQAPGAQGVEWSHSLTQNIFVDAVNISMLKQSVNYVFYEKLCQFIAHVLCFFMFHVLFIFS